MKTNIHPDANSVKITCSCGAEFPVNSTIIEDTRVEICSKCHPFYTGKQKLVDSAGRVDKFKARVSIKEKTAAERKGKKVKRAARAKTKEQEEEKESK